MGQGADGRRHGWPEDAQEVLLQLGGTGRRLEAHPGHTDMEQAEREARQRVGATMARAIEEAEAAVQRRAEADLAAEAYQNLSFDFPLVSTEALVALASTFRKALASNQLPPFPVTAPLVSGVLYLTKGGQGREPPVRPFSTPEQEGDDDELRARTHSIHTLAGFILLKLPAFCLAASREDGGALLRRALASYVAQSGRVHEPAEEYEESEEESREQESSVAAAIIAVDDGTGHAMAVEQDDDDTEWEPLEGASPPAAGPLPQTGQSEETSLHPPQPEHSLSWPDLLRGLAGLSRLLQFEHLSNPGAWAELQLTDCILTVLEGALRIGLQQPLGGEAELHVGLVVRAHVDLLCERLLTHPVGGDGGKDSLGKVVARVLRLVGVEREGVRGGGLATEGGVLPHAAKADGQTLALVILSSMCTRLPAGSNGAVERGSSWKREGFGSGGAAAMAKEQLWPEVGAALPWLGARLASLGGEKAAHSEWLGEISRVLAVLRFYVKAAPGNARLGPPLLESGVCRAAAGLFVRAGAAPAMEPLRCFMLLAAVAAPEVASYVAAIPAFNAVMASPSFCDASNPAASHALLWPLLLSRQQQLSGSNKEQTTDGEAPLAGEAARLTQLAAVRPLEFVELSAAASRMQRVLALLEEAAAMARGPPPRLWKPGGRLSGALAACQLAVRDAATWESALQDAPLPPGAEEEPHDGAVAGHALPLSSGNGCDEDGGAGVSELQRTSVGSAMDAALSVQWGGGDEGVVAGEEEDGEEKKRRRASEGKNGGNTTAEEARRKCRELFPKLAVRLKHLVALSRGSMAAVKSD